MDMNLMHIHIRGTTYHYRRRIPLELQQYTHTLYFAKALSKNKDMAMMLARNIDSIFDELLMTKRMGKEPDIGKLGIDQEKSVSEIKSYLTVTERSDDAQKTVTMHMELLSILLPEDLSGLTQETLDKSITILKKLPKRNIQKYKRFPIKELINMDIPKKDKLAPRGVNAYLKTLKSFLNFCYKRNYIEKQFDIPLIKSEIASRAERTALNINTIIKLINGAKTSELKSAYTLLYLTGMRLSEVFKCKVSMIDGVKCFDLTDTTIKLKTKNSYRLIPVHRSITEPEDLLTNIRSLHPEYIAKQCSKTLKSGTLYSLRHSFATDLASCGVAPHLISELMGHKQETMTLSRYIKGFPIEKLKQAIDTLTIKDYDNLT
ncbi:hypothetical protein AS592_10550 [Sulfurovum riftiae]|uniref:Tyr recombinase domain-containing protein n=2 Tax=Sulfurovum riftiae TaxID=1630136 RepID=A0A151CJ71_9BACT|nr:hypothetical protein AS592_10550 [Sulfurovum riftiae]